MKAIVTKFLPHTETKPARIRAKALDLAPITISIHNIPDAHDGSEAARHAYVASLLDTVKGWKGERITGAGVKPGEYVHVELPGVYLKAREAVLETRLAITRGQNNGNPHGRAYGKKVTELTDDEGPWAGVYQGYVRSTPYVRYYLVRFTPPEAPPTNWKLEEFSNYHAGQFNDTLQPEGIKREFAEILVRRWAKTTPITGGVYEYKLEGE